MLKYLTIKDMIMTVVTLAGIYAFVILAIVALG